MEKINQTRGLYQLEYGYSNHILLFVEAAENVQKMIDTGYTYWIETSKHSSEEVEVKYSKLVTTNKEFIDQFLAFELNTSNPYDCYLDEISDENEFLESQEFFKPSMSLIDGKLISDFQMVIKDK